LEDTCSLDEFVKMSLLLFLSNVVDFFVAVFVLLAGWLILLGGGLGGV